MITATATVCCPRHRSWLCGCSRRNGARSAAGDARFSQGGARARRDGTLLQCFGAFEFEGITRRLPTRTFSGALELQVGDKRVELAQVGPAHTRGDVLVHVPADSVVYSGDILFIEGHPIMWVGPVLEWIAACEHILALAPATVVPGHGPITDTRGCACSA